MPKMFRDQAIANYGGGPVGAVSNRAYGVFSPTVCFRPIQNRSRSPDLDPTENGMRPTHEGLSLAGIVNAIGY